MSEQQVVFTNDICQALADFTSGIGHDKLFILFDETTRQLCLPVLQPFIDGYEAGHAGRKVTLIGIPATDESKTVESLTLVWSGLSANGATRHSLLINVGGGMVTDLGGFAAATFKRGIHFINVATTLLGAVDAAVGGKTGINLGNLKNEVGAFAPADAVLISTRFFETLDQKNLLSGYAEMLKHGLLSEREALAKLLDYDIQHWENATLLPLLEYSVNVKREVVRQDPFEKGLRKALNLGHTFGHAFETFAMKSHRPVLHGYAVAWGLVCELIMSQQQCGFPSEVLYEIARYVRDNYGPMQFTCDDYDTLIELMRHDKKNEGDAINFTLMESIGHPSLNHSADKEEIGVVLDIYRDLMGI